MVGVFSGESLRLFKIQRIRTCTISLAWYPCLHSEDRARAIIEAMESIKADYENLRAVLLTRRPINFF
jgi:hypothetical protein